MAVLIVRKPAGEAPPGFSFNMTAGDLGGAAQGYADETSAGIGSIDAEPIPGETLQFLVTGTVINGINFHGDVLGSVTGRSVWVDSIQYPFDLSDWAYDSDNDVTGATWNTGVGAPVFVNTVSYFVEIK